MCGGGEGWADLHPLVVEVVGLRVVNLLEVFPHFLLLIQRHPLRITGERISLLPSLSAMLTRDELTFWMRRAILLSRYLTSRSNTKFFLLWAEIRALRSRSRF